MIEVSGVKYTCRDSMSTVRLIVVLAGDSTCALGDSHIGVVESDVVAGRT